MVPRSQCCYFHTLTSPILQQHFSFAIANAIIISVKIRTTIAMGSNARQLMHLVRIYVNGADRRRTIRDSKNSRYLVSTHSEIDYVRAWLPLRALKVFITTVKAKNFEVEDACFSDLVPQTLDIE